MAKRFFPHQHLDLSILEIGLLSNSWQLLVSGLKDVITSSILGSMAKASWGKQILKIIRIIDRKVNNINKALKLFCFNEKIYIFTILWYKQHNTRFIVIKELDKPIYTLIYFLFKKVFLISFQKSLRKLLLGFQACLKSL